MPKNRPRYLRLSLRSDTPGASEKTVLDTLMAAIQRGDYEYPKEWRVAIGWSNKPEADLRWGEFTAEMRKSAASSPGWDIAVLNYQEGQR
jgi:hypothetical protein